ncbi:MAG TPA: diaminopimelate decarboxylase [Stellaceae bacterium]|nr:diaminopimelate decarboxylase [Stellaceae bacterium]
MSGTEIEYRGGVLHVEGIALPAVAAEVGTPAYVYSAASMERQYRRFAAAVAPLGGRICYAVKANSNQAVIATFARLGAGADVVSEGELRRALAAGIPAERIVFSGVAKTEGELSFALAAGVGQINVESAPELETLSRLASTQRRVAAIAIRVNPDIDAGTHPKITTGKAENKFGIPIHQAVGLYCRALDLPGIDPAAVALHIGSQLLDLAPFEAAFARLASLVGELRAAGVSVRHLDLGGGIGVPARGEAPPDLNVYADIVRRTVGGLGCALTFEPGRLLVAEAGVLLTKVIVVKAGVHRRTVIQDGAMNDLIRPTLYEAYHPILPVAEPADGTVVESDVVGPVCESGDYLAVARALPPVAAGDLLAVGHAGAYGAVMSSTYNSRRLVPEVLVHGADWSVVRPRQDWEALIGADRLPPWLEPAR